MSDVPQLLRACSQGNKEACRTLIDILWLGPMLAREFKKLLGPVAIVPIPKPWPGPNQAPLLDANFLRDGDLIRLAMGGPNPQPSIISIAEQLKAATEFRAALDNASKALVLEMKRLQR